MENGTGIQPKKLNILLADDFIGGQSIMEMCLRRLGYNFKRVDDGLKAVDYCRNNPDVDLVLMDIHMPVMDGFEAALEIRKFNKEMAIIAIAPVGFFSIKEIMENGCNDLIEKPITIGLLISMINKYQPL